MNEELAAEVADARRRFDEACEQLHPDLHRFCTRMTGSPCDGEDVLQEVLMRAFYRLSELREVGSLRSWLFRIAHNKCSDFRRSHGRFVPLDEAGLSDDEVRTVDDEIDRKQRAQRALTSMVAELPPKERACLVLKDVLDCSLEETADITGSSVGAVKAALHRGRDKLERAAQAQRPPQRLAPGHRALAEQYIAAFNARDWAGVRALLADGAQLEVVHRSEGPFGDDGYFVNYGRLSWNWRLALAVVDGVESVVHYREVAGVWTPHTIVQLGIEGDKVSLVRDYIHVAYLLGHSSVEREGA